MRTIVATLSRKSSISESFVQKYPFPINSPLLQISEGPDCVADPFGPVPCRCFHRPRKRKRTNRESPRKNRENPGKIGEVPKRIRKDKKGYKRIKKGIKKKDKKRIKQRILKRIKKRPDRGAPTVEPPPRLAALAVCNEMISNLIQKIKVGISKCNGHRN